MTLERLLQISVASMTVLGTLLFGMGQQDLILPLAGFAFAVTAVLFTDTLKWLRLHPNVANIFAVAVAVYTFHNFFQSTSEEKLLAIAYLLAYLQFALLFEVKQPRIYWHLMVLSLLQVVVAAALDFGLEGAIVFCVYFACSIGALTLFLMHREALRIKRLAATAPHVELTGNGQHAETTPEQAAQKRATSAISLAMYPPEFAFHELPWRLLIRQLVGLSLVSLTIAFVIFYTIPRRDQTADSDMAETHLVGFDPEVDLGDEDDEITETDELAMRVSFKDFDTGKPYNVIGEPYIRGTILTRYIQIGSGRRSRWLTTFGVLERQRVNSFRDPNTDYVIQEIQLEKQLIDSRKRHEFEDVIPLFGAFPLFRLAETDPKIYFDTRKGQLYRPVARYLKSNREGYKYITATTAMKGGYQVADTPFRLGRRRDSNLHMGSDEELRLTAFEPARFPYLRRLTDQILVEKRVNRTDPLQICLALESHLRTSGIYTYSLDMAVDPVEDGIDPVEEFLKNRQIGHCEYFASALALMLRYQKIPSRLVVGFKGGEYNSVGKYYEIAQSNAHAWVEAYLKPGQEGRGMLGVDHVGPTGAWFRLDPTPPERTYDLGEFEITFLHRVADVLDYAQVLWSDYVVQLSALRQPILYDPFRESPGLYSEPIQRGLSYLHRDDEVETEAKVLHISQRSLSFIALGVGLFAILAMIFVYQTAGARGGDRATRWVRPSWLERIVKPVAPWLVKWYRSTVHDEATRQYIEFYEKLLSLLNRHGFHRAAGQTQREFADAVSSNLAANEQRQHVADVPPRIIQNYYRVRFGSIRLEPQEREKISRDLNMLRDALALD